MPRKTSEQEPPDRYLIPINGLNVPCQWQIGRVSLYPGANGAELIRDAPPFDTEGSFFRESVLEVLDSARESTIAEVPGKSGFGAAIDEVRASLGILRLFQLLRHTIQPTSFGLTGDVMETRIDYIAIWDNSAPGSRMVGDYVGYTFSQDSYDDWCSSATFQFLSKSLADQSPDEGARRGRDRSTTIGSG